MIRTLDPVPAPHPIQGAQPAGFDGRNILTIDVEDYFHANGLGCEPATWDQRPHRVDYNTRRLLGILGEQGVRATFFVLGWVAERYPDLVRAIRDDGHELASHGYGHRLVHEQDSSAFRDDVVRSRMLLEDISGTRVTGYRAPSFSLPNDEPWAFETLLQAGYTYDSSIFPVRGARYGDPTAERRIHRIETGSGSLLEIPPSCLPVAGRNIPVAGGGYFRFFPERFTRYAIRRLNRGESMPAVVYLHPWEIDPDQPRLSARRIDAFRHYVNLDRTETRLEHMLRDFRFDTASAVTGLDRTRERTERRSGEVA